MSENIDDDYTIYLSAEAEESLASYICSVCGGEMIPQENEDTLICLNCGKIKQVNFYDIGIGDELCGAKVIRVLGGGSSGCLYLCEYPDYSRSVMKMLKKGASENAENIRRFEQEAQIMGKLSHPYIVQLYEFSQTSNAMYLNMEYVDGFNLLQMVSQNYSFSVDNAMDMTYGLADAFRYAWEHCHLLHRDIKPSNIMINSDGELKILDFGLSKECNIDTGLTAVGQALGSPGFMSPEQFRDSRIYDCRSDIFSLGVTIYFVLTGGKMPYQGKSALAAYQSMLTEKPQTLHEIDSSIPESFSNLINSMIDKDVEKRPKSWQDLMKQLEDIAQTL